MKVFHLLAGFHPGPMMGSGAYVCSLARAERALGVDSWIAAPGAEDARLELDGLPVRLFAPGGNAEQAFLRLAGRELPDAVHLHVYPGLIGWSGLAQLRRSGIATLLTYHVPSVSCSRGTLMLWGARACDGVIRPSVCSLCVRQSRIANGKPLPQLFDRIRELGRESRALLSGIDRVLAPSEWARAVCIRNGAPPEKVVLCRHGLPETAPPPAESGRSEGPLRIAFFGRMDPVKGVALLVRAVRAVRAPVTLDLFGIFSKESEIRFMNEVRRLAGEDARIRMRAPVLAGRTTPVLRGYDLLAVPSQWLETGPLVVLEAFAAGVPVVGSRLGGIAEQVRDGVDGLLLPHRSVRAWSRAFERLARDRALLARLKSGIRPPRRIESVADQTAAVYRALRPERQAAACR